MHDIVPLRMPAYIAVYCLLSGLVLALTADNVLGRQGIHVDFLPRFFRSRTLTASSQQPLESYQDYEAISTARAAVVKRPLSVEALSALALSSAASKPDMSSKALAQAASLGWRNANVQAVVIKSAALERKWSVAAPRLLALSNLNGLDALDSSVFVAAVDRSYAAKVAPAFAHNGVAWFKYAQWLKDQGLEKEREHILAQTLNYNRETDCVRLGLVAQQLVLEGRIDMAANLVRSRCESYITRVSDTITIDEHFGDTRRGPFEWQMVAQPGVSVRVGMNGGKAIVEVENGDPVTRVIASRLLSNESGSADLHTHFELSDLSNPLRKIKPLLFECQEFNSMEISDKTASTAFRASDCRFVRVKLKLPNGRFQLRADDSGFQRN